MSATYVFLSHCVRPTDQDPERTLQQKRELIEYLEGRGFGVFDYAERPGGHRDWMNEIREQFLNCGCVIYFAKQWPEDDPGVVMIEVGAALLVGRPFLIYSPNGRRGEPFSGYSQGLCHAVSASREIVCSRLEELAPKLTSIARSPRGKPSPFIVLTNAFLRKDWHENYGLSKFHATQTVMRALLETGHRLLKLEPESTQNAVAGCWRIPHAAALVFLRGDTAATVETAVFENGNWRRQASVNTQLPAVGILDQLYSAGVHSDQTLLLLKAGSDWSLLTQTGHTPLTVPPELNRAVRRTNIVTEPGSDLPVFYADGACYRIRPGDGRIEQAPDSSATVPEDFAASLSATLHARLAHIHGLNGPQALIAGGRAEGFTLPGQAPGFWFYGDTLQLGTWKPIPPGDTVRQFLIDPDGFRQVSPGDIVAIEREAKHIGARHLESRTAPEFDWLLSLLQQINPDVLDHSGTHYTYDQLAPIALIPSLTMGVLTREVPKGRGAGYYRFDLAWTAELRQRLWSILGHGPHPF